MAGKGSHKKIEGVMPFGFSPSFNCAAKFLTLSGSISRENKTAGQTWQEGLRRFCCGKLCVAVEKG
jgi:hypothetical protein